MEQATKQKTACSRFSATLPEHLVYRLKIRGLREKKTLKTLLVEAIEKFLAN